MTKLDRFWGQLSGLESATPYVLLDAAGFERGRAEFPDSIFAVTECLFTGDLEEELEDVAPYLALLASTSADVKIAIDALLQRHLAILVILREPSLPFTALHRHFRKLNVVYGPSGSPMFFRYYDPRSLLEVLQVLDAAQRRAFFGPVESLVFVDAAQRLLVCMSDDDGLVVSEMQ